VPEGELHDLRRELAGGGVFLQRLLDLLLRHQLVAASQLAPEIVELPFWHAVTLASIGREAEAAPIFKAVFAKEPVWADLLERLPAAGLFPDDRALIERIKALRER
jgi:hypothetical protein